MSQRAVESVLGRLISDGEFRREFFAEPEAALDRHGLELTTVELAGLSAVEQRLVESLADRLDTALKRGADTAGSRRSQRARILEFPLDRRAKREDEELLG